MCLASVKETRKPNDDMMVGYKIFLKNSWGLSGEFYDMYTPKHAGEVYEASYGRLYASDGTYYDSGFHAFTTVKGAWTWIGGIVNHPNLVIYEVHIWDIRAIGTQHMSRCIVGKNMRIVKEVK
jgi:hypothetical protein